MSNIAIVTDTTAYLSAELIAELGIHVVSLHVAYGDGREELESEVNFGAFYDYLVTAENLPETAPPTVEQFVDVYGPLVEAGKDVVSIHISSGLSRTCAMAREAVTRLDGEGGAQRVHIIDSATAGGALALLVIAAARKSRTTSDVVEVVNAVREARQESNIWFALDTLDYLKRGGRIGGAAAWMGTRLNVKPILTIGSEITAVERVRTRERARERLLDYGRRLHAAGREGWVVQHTHCADEANEFADRLREILWRPPEFVLEIGPVIGTHTGPGLMGIAGLPSRFLE
jgi:DegV family protein with EDD domain